MSRSYKHTPRCGQRKSGWYKNYYNRILRRNSLTHEFQHMDYKRLDRAYNICDYESVGYPFEKYYVFELELWRRFDSRRGVPCPTRQQVRNEYNKTYLRK